MALVKGQRVYKVHYACVSVKRNKAHFDYKVDSQVIEDASFVQFLISNSSAQVIVHFSDGTTGSANELFLTLKAARAYCKLLKTTIEIANNVRAKNGDIIWVNNATEIRPYVLSQNGNEWRLICPSNAVENKDGTIVSKRGGRGAGFIVGGGKEWANANALYSVRSEAQEMFELEYERAVVRDLMLMNGNFNPNKRYRLSDIK